MKTKSPVTFSGRVCPVTTSVNVTSFTWPSSPLTSVTVVLVMSSTLGFLRAAPADPGDADGLQVDAELDGLVGHALGEFRPGDVIEPRVVLDRLGVEQLAARSAALEHHGFDPRSSGVQGGGQAGRPSADDDHIVVTVFFHRLRSSHVI